MNEQQQKAKEEILSLISECKAAAKTAKESKGKLVSILANMSAEDLNVVLISNAEVANAAKELEQVLTSISN